MPGQTDSQFEMLARALTVSILDRIDWNPDRATFSARFFRRPGRSDGADQPDPCVALVLSHVKALAAGFDSENDTARPSSLKFPSRLAAADLKDRRLGWSALLWPDLDDALDAAQLDWLAGDRAALARVPQTLCLRLNDCECFEGMPALCLWFLAGGESLTLESGGVPMAIESWLKHFHDSDASSQEAEVVAPEAVLGDTLDRGYRPPAGPIVELEPSDVPKDVFGPIGAYFEAHHRQDWLAMARLIPEPGYAAEDFAQVIEKTQMGEAFGQWAYLRRIDYWWVEGRRACVVVRGIEHVMADGDRRAENRQSLWTFQLRFRGNRWIIDSYSQSWPPNVGPFCVKCGYDLRATQSQCPECGKAIYPRP